MKPRRLTSPTLSAFQTHPFQMTLAGLFLVSAASLVQAGFQVALGPDRSLPVALVVAFVVGLVLGGFGMVTGLLWRGSGVVARGIERAGLYLSGASWLSIGFTLAVVSPVLAWASIANAAIIVAGCAARISALHKVDRVVVEIARLADEEA